MATSDFDPKKKEQELREESDSWDTSAPADAVLGDIPVVDISAYLATGKRSDLDNVAETFGEAFVVNSGELLKHWSNDRFLSTRHFANNSAHTSRYSMPFFFNATADYPMTCLPTCWDEHNPPKYPTISYL